uniref:Uncharacterized protein n=1 Tax=Anopheles atroparvus TaxID=41427 RepID=A0A182JGU7_ANOAO
MGCSRLHKFAGTEPHQPGLGGGYDCDAPNLGKHRATGGSPWVHRADSPMVRCPGAERTRRPNARLFTTHERTTTTTTTTTDTMTHARATTLREASRPERDDNS